MEEGKDVGLSIRSVPLGFCPRECRIRGASALGTSPAISLPRIEAWAWDTEGLSYTHVCQECDKSLYPNFGLSLIPWWLGHFGDMVLGDLQEQSRDTGAGGGFSWK